jgi:hypothetical protein
MFLNRIKAALLASAIGLAAVAPSFALYTDPGIIAGTQIVPERTCQVGQNVCYLRATINFNDPSIANGVWAFTLPANAYILAVDLAVTTAFNATSTNTLQIGTTAAGTDLLAATSITSTGVTHATTAAGLGTVVTGNTAKQTAINGAVPVYFKYVQTGTAATTGVVTVVMTFAKNNDK